MEDIEFKTTIDHDEMQEWFEEHDAVPALINRSENDGEGILAVKFPNSDQAMQEISWQEFLDRFESDQLAFRYDGESNEPGIFIYNFINREEMEADSSDFDGRELPEDDIPVENLFGSADEHDDGVTSLSADTSISLQEL